MKLKNWFIFLVLMLINLDVLSTAIGPPSFTANGVVFKMKPQYEGKLLVRYDS